MRRTDVDEALNAELRVIVADALAAGVDAETPGVIVDRIRQRLFLAVKANCQHSDSGLTCLDCLLVAHIVGGR